MLVMVQAALLYTSVSGQRRLRVTNLSLNISDNMGELYRSGIRVNANTNADPHWFQCGFGNGSGSSVFGQCGSGSRSRVLITKNLEKFTAEKKRNFSIKNCNLFNPWPP
jgi:hypothetical protein